MSEPRKKPACSRNKVQFIDLEYLALKCKGGRTPTASRQASRHERKETKADVSIMTKTGVRRFL
jgi:hypothetical protein